MLWEGLRQRAPKLANLLPPYESQSDLVQTVSAKLLEWAAKDFRGTTDGELWKAAHMALKRAAFDEGDRAAARHECAELDPTNFEDPDALPLAALAESDQRERLVKLVDALPEADRLLFRLHYFESATYGQLANLLGNGKTEESVGDRVRGLLAKLRGRGENA